MQRARSATALESKSSWWLRSSTVSQQFSGKGLWLDVLGAHNFIAALGARHVIDKEKVLTADIAYTPGP